MVIVPKVIIPFSGVKRFVASEHLVIDKFRNYTSKNFKGLFLDKVEQDVPAGNIVVQALIKDPSDPDPMLVDLGQTQRAIHLAHFFELLEKRKNGDERLMPLSSEEGVAASCIGKDGNVWIVKVGWLEDDFTDLWEIYVYPNKQLWLHDGLTILSQAD